MKINDFKLECFFGVHEFTAPNSLTQSDCESMTISDLLAMEPGAKEQFLNHWLGYTETWGDPALRTQIAALYRDMEMENVLVFHGAQEAIFAYMNVMLNPGDHMIVMYPNYQSLYEVANSVHNCTFSKWELHDTPQGWSIDFQELRNLIQPNTKIIAINTPNNPTGYTFTNEELTELAAICQHHGIHLFADEVYKGLEMDGEPRSWVADTEEHAVSLGVMSKSYGLPGLRVGWLVTKNRELLDKIVKFKHYMSICDAGPSEFLAKIALRHGDEILAQNLARIQENIAQADIFFEKYSHIFEKKTIPCGPIAFHKLLLDMPVEEFCQKAVEKKGVLLLPASIYDMEENYFRMGYGRSNFPHSLAQFDIFLQEEGY